MKHVIILAIAFVLLIPASVFADSYSMDISRGSDTPGCEKNNSCFEISNALVEVGDTLTWYNVDSAAHTITGGTPSEGPDGRFDSGLISSGKSYFLTFSYADRFPYFCVIHPWMTGVVTVKEQQKASTQISLNVYPDVVRDGSTVSISGKLTSNGKGVSGAGIYIKDYDPLDIVHDPIGNVVTDSNGNFKVNWKVRDLDSGDRRFSALLFDFLGGFGTVSAANSLFNLMESTTVEVFATYNGNSFYQKSKSCYDDCRNNVITITGTSTESKIIGMVLDSVAPGSSDALKFASILNSNELSESDYSLVESKLRSAFAKELGIDASTLSMVNMVNMLENPAELEKLKNTQKSSQTIPNPTPKNTEKYTTFANWVTTSKTVYDNQWIYLEGSMWANSKYDGRWDFVKDQMVYFYNNGVRLGGDTTDSQGNFQFAAYLPDGKNNFSVKYGGSNEWFASTTQGPTITVKEKLTIIQPKQTTKSSEYYTDFERGPSQRDSINEQLQLYDEKQKIIKNKIEQLKSKKGLGENFYELSAAAESMEDIKVLSELSQLLIERGFTAQAYKDILKENQKLETLIRGIDRLEKDASNIVDIKPAKIVPKKTIPTDSQTDKMLDDFVKNLEQKQLKKEVEILQTQSHENLLELKKGVFAAQESLKQLTSNTPDGTETINKAWDLLKINQKKISSIESKIKQGDTQLTYMAYSNAKSFFIGHEKSSQEIGDNLKEISKLIEEAKPKFCFLFWCW